MIIFLNKIVGLILWTKFSELSLLNAHFYFLLRFVQPVAVIEQIKVYQASTCLNKTFIKTHSLNNVKYNFYTKEGRQIKHLKRLMLLNSLPWNVCKALWMCGISQPGTSSLENKHLTNSSITTVSISWDDTFFFFFVKFYNLEHCCTEVLFYKLHCRNKKKNLYR